MIYGIFPPSKEKEEDKKIEIGIEIKLTSIEWGKIIIENKKNSNAEHEMRRLANDLLACGMFGELLD